MNIQQLRHKHKSALVQHAFKITGHHKDFPAAEKFESEWVDYLLHGGEINQMLLALKNAKPVDFTPPDPNNFDASGCSISLIENSLPKMWQANEVYTLQVCLHNGSNMILKTDLNTPINLCYHWYDSNGEVCVFDGLRSELTDCIYIEKNKNLSVNVQTPDDAGDYFLSFTLVWEGHFWMEDRNLKLEKIKVKLENKKLSPLANDIYHQLLLALK